MEHARDVAQFWSWLPAFRAVAETEHLPSAGKALCVSMATRADRVADFLVERVPLGSIEHEGIHLPGSEPERQSA